MALRTLYRQSDLGTWIPVFDAITIADTFWQRLRGLLGSTRLTTQQGLLLSPCHRIHTLGMRVSLDIVFIDNTGCVVCCVPDVKPWRQVGAGDARYTLELASGSLQRSGIRVGELLKWS